MALIVAIEPNREQAAQIATIARGRIGAELVLADSVERALRELGARIPDLILTPQLLSPRDDAAITDRLRELGDDATHVQTLTIPALATEQPRVEARARGLLSALRRQKAPSAGPGGCAPDVFAEQIAVYLERALEARATADHAEHAPVVAPVIDPPFAPPLLEPESEPPAVEPRVESPVFEPRFESPTLLADCPPQMTPGLVFTEVEIVVEPETVPVPEITLEIVERTPPIPAKPAVKKRKTQPAENDDWSFFDPAETRFAALIARLDEITRSNAVGQGDLLIRDS